MSLPDKVLMRKIKNREKKKLQLLKSKEAEQICELRQTPLFYVPSINYCQRMLFYL